MPADRHYDPGHLDELLEEALRWTVRALQCACDARVPLRVHAELVRAHAALLAAEKHAPAPPHRAFPAMEGIQLAVDIDPECPF